MTTIDSKCSDKISKLKKMNAYEALWADFDILVRMTISEEINILDFRNKLKVLIDKIIREVTGYENYFINLLSCLEPPHKFVSHSLNTAIFAYILSDYLHIDRNIVPKLIHAALFHDIGKLNFSDKIKDLIVYKNEDSGQATRFHPIWGERVMLYHLKTAPEIARMVLNHHEQNDGTGYPRQLKSSSLTLHDHIIAAANLIDNIIRKLNFPYFDVLAKNMEALLSNYSAKFVPEICDILKILFVRRSEGRKNRRVKISTKGTIESVYCEKPIPCNIRDISSGGVEITTGVEVNEALPYKINAKISSNLTIKNIIGKVVWFRTDKDQFIYGMKFDETAEVDLTQIIGNESAPRYL